MCIYAFELAYATAYLFSGSNYGCYVSISGLFCIRNQEERISACIKRRNHVSVLFFCYETININTYRNRIWFMDTYLMNMK